MGWEGVGLGRSERAPWGRGGRHPFHSLPLWSPMGSLGPHLGLAMGQNPVLLNSKSVLNPN